MTSRNLSTRIPSDLADQVDELCGRLGLKKSFVVEQALREKIEDLLDAEDLRGDIRNATGFYAWEKVKAETHRRKRR